MNHHHALSDLTGEELAILTVMSRTDDEHLTAAMIAEDCGRHGQANWARGHLERLVALGKVDDAGNDWYVVADAVRQALSAN